MSVVLDRTKYAELLSKTLPRVIRNDSQLEEFTEALWDLDEIEKPSREERELAELLTTLIEHYEREHFPLRNATPVEIINLLLEQKGMSAKDIWDVFGSKGTTSDVLKGRRKIGPAVAAKLGRFFGVAPELFIDWR
jgi:HTH-type transcriptional regulator/antitoxin HigA